MGEKISLTGMLAQVCWPEAPEITGPPDEDEEQAIRHWVDVTLISIKAVAQYHGIELRYVDPKTGEIRKL